MIWGLTKSSLMFHMEEIHLVLGLKKMARMDTVEMMRLWILARKLNMAKLSIAHVSF